MEEAPVKGPGQLWCVGCNPPPLSAVSGTVDRSFHPAGKALKRPRCGSILLELLLGLGWTWLAVDLVSDVTCIYSTFEQIRVRTPPFTTAWVSCSISWHGGACIVNWFASQLHCYLWTALEMLQWQQHLYGY